MDKSAFYTNNRNTTKTDLSLLLECLKSQMKCPDLQKQALTTIHSICENREDNVDLLREMGGVVFVYNLSKSSVVHSDVRETALFTLGTLAEANVYCKNSLCRKEIFGDLARWLMKENAPLTRRVSLYLLSVLVANNKAGQTLAQTTGCLDILLDLFRTTFPVSAEVTWRAADVTQTYQIWASVSSALCGCVNNPQNEEGQRFCVAVFPVIKIWFQQIPLSSTEIFQPICSFIAMTVANNLCVQESFSASGGLETLTLVLVTLASGTEMSLLSCQLSVTISKTLSACITNNSSLASRLARYGVVPHLFSLLACPNLDCEDRLTVLLTLGHCTEASEEHQHQLVQCGGLPLVITLLTEDTSEEVRKTAAFILQTCKQATMSLGERTLTDGQEEVQNVKCLTDMQGFRSSARELLCRLNLLEAEDEQEDKDPHASTEELGKISLPSALPLYLRRPASFKTIPTAHRETSSLRRAESQSDPSIKLQTAKNVILGENDTQMGNMSSILNTHRIKASRGSVLCSVCKGTGTLMSSLAPPLEGDRETHMAASQMFVAPDPMRHGVPKETECTDGEKLQNNDLSKVVKNPKEDNTLHHARCPGCVLPFEQVTSRTFSSLMSSCHQSCDMHKVLQEATECFRTYHYNLLLGREYQDNSIEPKPKRVSAAEPQRSQKNWKGVSLTPIRKGSGQAKCTLPGQHWTRYNGIALTPLRRRVEMKTSTSDKKNANGEE